MNGTRKHASSAEVERSVELDIPVGAIVIEAWSDEATFVAFNDAEYEPTTTAHRCGSPTSRSRADGSGPTRKRWSTGSTNSTSRCCCGRSRSCPSTATARSHRPPPPRSRADAAHARSTTACACTKTTAPRTTTAAGGSPAGSARLDQPRHPTMVDRQAPLPARRARDRRVQDRRRRTRMGRRTALPRRHPRRTRPTTCSPNHYADRVPRPHSQHRHRRRHVQPRRLHRRRHRPVPLGRRRGLDLGSVSGVDHRRSHRRRQRRPVLGLGHRRLLRRDPERRALGARHRDGRTLSDHAVPRRVQPRPNTVQRPHPLEPRRATRRRSRDHHLPAVRAPPRTAAAVHHASKPTSPSPPASR